MSPTNPDAILIGTDDAIWDRLHLLPFDRRFDTESRDPDLRGKLHKELPGILNWAMNGVRMWQQRGLDAPKEVMAAVDEYREDQDLIGAFLDDCFTLAKEACTAANAIYLIYRHWCSRNGERPWSQTLLGRVLGEREGLTSIRTGGERRWCGLVDSSGVYDAAVEWAKRRGDISEGDQ